MEKYINTTYSEGMVLDIDESRQPTLEFLNNNHVGVLATADAKGRPHASTVYLVSDRVLNIYFVTKKETQKARNLAENPHASVALFDAETQVTVQIDGEVQPVEDMDAANRIFIEIQGIARRTSSSGIPPVTELSAGGYITYRLSPSDVQMTTYGRNGINKEEVPGTLF